MAEFNTVLTGRSSIRGYKKDMLSPEQIQLLIDAALQAPTAINKQEIFVSAVSTSADVVAQLQKELNPNAEKTFYYGAPMLFILSGDDSFKWSAVDAGIAVENMHLAAKAMGLGSVIIGCIDGVMHGPNQASYAEQLKMPAGYSYKIALAAGYPAVEKAAHDIAPDKNSTIIM